MLPGNFVAYFRSRIYRSSSPIVRPWTYSDGSVMPTIPLGSMTADVRQLTIRIKGRMEVIGQHMHAGRLCRVSQLDGGVVHLRRRPPQSAELLRLTQFQDACLADPVALLARDPSTTRSRIRVPAASAADQSRRPADLRSPTPRRAATVARSDLQQTYCRGLPAASSRREPALSACAGHRHFDRIPVDRVNDAIVASSIRCPIPIATRASSSTWACRSGQCRASVPNWTAARLVAAQT